VSYVIEQQVVKRDIKAFNKHISGLKMKCLEMSNATYTRPFRHISFAELVQQAGLGSASAELLSARCRCSSRIQKECA
jgi:hypothetical protein